MRSKNIENIKLYETIYKLIKYESKNEISVNKAKAQLSELVHN